MQTAEEQYIESEVLESTESRELYLATVVELFDDGCAKIMFDGEEEAAEKKYPYISTYIPAVDDRVILGQIGPFYVILGAVNYDVPPISDVIYVTKDEFDEHKHDTIVSASNSTAGINVSSSGILPLSSTGTANYLGSSSRPFPAIYGTRIYRGGVEIDPTKLSVVSGSTTYSLTLSSTNLNPSTTNRISLGSSSYTYSDGYFTSLHVGGMEVDSSKLSVLWGTTTYSLTLTSTNLNPSVTNRITLGSSSYSYLDGYFHTLHINGAEIDASKLSVVSGSTTYSLTLSTTNFNPSVTNRIILGTSSLTYADGYFTKLHIGGVEVNPARLAVVSGSTTYAVTLSTTNLNPSVTNRFSLGTSSLTYADGYFTSLHVGGVEVNPARVTYSSSYYLMLTSSAFYPNSSGRFTLGNATYRWSTIYSTSATIQTSDRREKMDIETLCDDDRYAQLFTKLQPVRYKLKDGESGRYHTGFIAQEIEKSMTETGIDSQEFAAFVHNPEADAYGLRYEEIVSINTMMIQKLMARVEALESQVAQLQMQLQNN